MELLIADASSTARRTIRNALSHAGLTGICEAERGDQALALIGRLPVRAVVVGAVLEDMSGINLAMRIRTQPAHRRTPLLMVSERRSPEDVLTAVDAGIDHYILIPFPDDLLVEKVRLALAQAAEHAAAAVARRTRIQRIYTPRG